MYIPCVAAFGQKLPSRAPVQNFPETVLSYVPRRAPTLRRRRETDRVRQTHESRTSEHRISSYSIESNIRYFTITCNSTLPKITCNEGQASVLYTTTWSFTSNAFSATFTTAKGKRKNGGRCWRMPGVCVGRVAQVDPWAVEPAPRESTYPVARDSWAPAVTCYVFVFLLRR